ncbi:hypothetical protein [Phenylobacterium sp.]|uniref:hypothetical protein n=1 Tax=Phenylobacterium sp. TaxID=1871053 RepID=UPI0035B4E2F6
MRFIASTLEGLKLELEREFDRPRAPGAPTPIFSSATDGLPAAASYPGCLVRLSDLNILAVSDGSSWIRQDTGAAIA